ncbi:N-6 DNA methylase [Candidatus Pacearchaeota archaeon]|nr:N-6 DNA methylase [Candidatus Pacearchaeota archaeon]
MDIKNNDDKLKEFVSIFSKDSILEKKFVEELYKQSVIEEKEFTKEFYKLFHETRLMLIEEFKANEELHDKIRTPIHFAQLYLNRLMFILFAEDTGKLPLRVFEERILKILKSEGLISDHSRYVSDTIRDLFVSVDKGATTPDKIFGFNGGLFEAPIPNKIYFKDIRDKKFFNEVYQHSQFKKEIKLDDDSQKILNTHGDKLNPLIKNLLLMAHFDFKTEVNVNILGHIFEHSITDIEALQEGDTSRRKKEGVYYTPEYITDYIGRNTIIPYLSVKSAKTPRELVLEHVDNIGKLEKKFREIKIVDPACGSGAFLIKAVDILLEIHKEIRLFKQDEGAYTAIKKGLKVKKDVGQLILGKWVEEDEARTIIENNIFGVDINEESVEITKLSLFLKIARKNKKLINLSNNIKVGNSLIENLNVDERAFKWEEEFKEIFKEGKFDIVIGNPPYVFTRGNEYFNEIKHYIWDNYEHNKGKINLYSVFLELALERLIEPEGHLGFITPETFIRTSTYSDIRAFVSKNFDIKKINIYGIGVFEGVTAETITLVIKNKYSQKNKVIFKTVGKQKTEEFIVPQKSFESTPENRFIYNIDSKDQALFFKMGEECLELGGIVDVRNGIATKAGKKGFIANTRVDSNYKKLLEAPELTRYGFYWSGHFINYDKKALHRPRKEKTFLSKKIMIQRVSNRLVCTYDNESYYTFNSINNLILFNEDFSLKYILCILNSKMMNHYYRKNFSLDASYTITVTKKNLDVLPIKNISKLDQKPFIENANIALDLKRDYHNKIRNFSRLLKSNFGFEKVSKKLMNFYKLNFEEFKNELERVSSVEISLERQTELMGLFDKSKKETLELVDKIKETNDLIDRIVYKLYGLTDEEIKIVEENV